MENSWEKDSLHYMLLQDNGNCEHLLSTRGAGHMTDGLHFQPAASHQSHLQYMRRFSSVAPAICAITWEFKQSPQSDTW
jgi:hypothetical protein